MMFVCSFIAAQELLLLQPQRKEKPKIGPTEGNDALLARLQAFLPALKESNEQLPQSLKHCDTIELPEQYDGKHVALDLACGVFDLNDEDAVRAAETCIHIHPTDVKGDDEGKTTTDDNDDSESDDIHPGIQELN